MLEIVQLPVLSDNYIFLVHEPESGQTAAVDPAVAQPVLEALENRSWHLDFVFNTHHHGDHVGGNLELKRATGCKVVGAEGDRRRIPGIDIGLSDGDTFGLGNVRFEILETPGHTLGHIVFYAPTERVLFCGDTLFAMGCGRLFEGSADQMWQSLQKLRDLPEPTEIYCAHEYTQANGRFALTVEPENRALRERLDEVARLRADNRSTLPSTVALERATNPFFRPDVETVQAAMNLNGAPTEDVFAEIRRRKDVF
ncbi:MAG: hydroxyacylglutathione hydrolase [Gammaproteobacteria bacterium]